MRTLLDIHTHTIASGHAFSTVQEMVETAKEKGLKVLGITEHAPGIPGACDPIYFKNLYIVPRIWHGVRLLLGCELDILDTKGTLDLNEEYYQKMDIRIAGIHSLCWEGGTKEENTQGMINAIKNPWTHVISHPGDGTAELIYEPIVLAAKEHHTLLEINSSSMRPTRHKASAKANYTEILQLCKAHRVPIILGSDAHICFDIANYEYALPLLAETDFPEELVMNDKPEAFFRYLDIPEEISPQQQEYRH